MEEGKEERRGMDMHRSRWDERLKTLCQGLGRGDY